MSDNEQIRGDHDTSLLEGLFQLVVDGQTQGWEFEQLSSEVYDRLKETYEHAAIGSAKVQLRGSMAG